ncbi:PREDICTED: collagen alpha-1(I) chain-like [Chinchilla lanigera]|uniref:collagen alpha-1(I) chain-like n=1 Tax=Chinchilla lanigera TaxID=34839 RepID=UPI0006978AEB|nr:PREDICTED: collagen alpha-1(I) chain-like [Chinchilla lanigera]
MTTLLAFSGTLRFYGPGWAPGGHCAREGLTAQRGVAASSVDTGPGRPSASPAPQLPGSRPGAEALPAPAASQSLGKGRGALCAWGHSGLLGTAGASGAFEGSPRARPASPQRSPPAGGSLCPAAHRLRGLGRSAQAVVESGASLPDHWGRRACAAGALGRCLSPTLAVRRSRIFLPPPPPPPPPFQCPGSSTEDGRSERRKWSPSRQLSLPNLPGCHTPTSARSAAWARGPRSPTPPPCSPDRPWRSFCRACSSVSQPYVQEYDVVCLFTAALIRTATCAELFGPRGRTLIGESQTEPHLTLTQVWVCPLPTLAQPLWSCPGLSAQADSLQHRDASQVFRWWIATALRPKAEPGHRPAVPNEPKDGGGSLQDPITEESPDPERTLRETTFRCGGKEAS